ncbi:MAPK phosphothreonine lyase [Pseudomonas zeae]
MPPSRENFALNAQAHLRAQFDRLQQQMLHAPAPHFRETLAADYSAAQNNCEEQPHDFRLFNCFQEAFIKAKREQPHDAGGYVGDKLHLSVGFDQVPKAFNVISRLLLSDDCPVDEWKVTDVALVGSSERVAEGAQFTLYVKPQKADPQYTAEGLNSLRHFVLCLESVLTGNDIQPGRYPSSDVRPDHWQFCSYRNEYRSEREGNESQDQSLRDEPFFRLISTPLPH